MSGRAFVLTAFRARVEKESGVLLGLGFVALYLSLATGLLFLAFSHWGYDDPFITYRYAENLGRGLGFVYNPGERVLSTTTPLFALLLAGLGTLGGDLPALAVGIGAFSLALGALLLWDLARAWGTPAAGWFGLILYPTFPLAVSTLGSETPLYLALCIAAFTGYARRRYHLAALFAALAVLTRPDGVLVPALLSVGFLLGKRPLPSWSAVLLFIVPVLAWVGFAWVYFGSPIPATLNAKQHQGAMALSKTFFERFPEILAGYQTRLHYRLEAYLALLGSGTLLWRLRRWARRWLLFILWPALYFAAYAYLDVSGYFWYYIPLLPGFLALAGLGGQLYVDAIGLLKDRSSARRLKTGAHFAGSAGVENAPDTARSHLQADLTARKGRILASLPGGRTLPDPAWLGWASTILLVILLGLYQAGDLARMRHRVDNRLGIYRAAGEWLDDNVPPQATIGTLEVGIIGYYAGNPMVDFAGLIQPPIAGRLTRKTGYEDAALWAVARYHPDLLVLHDGIMPRLEATFVQDRCVPIRRFPGSLYAYTVDLVVYACREHP